MLSISFCWVLASALATNVAMAAPTCVPLKDDGTPCISVVKSNYHIKGFGTEYLAVLFQNDCRRSILVDLVRGDQSTDVSNVLPGKRQREYCEAKTCKGYVSYTPRCSTAEKKNGGRSTAEKSAAAVANSKALSDDKKSPKAKTAPSSKEWESMALRRDYKALSAYKLQRTEAAIRACIASTKNQCVDSLKYDYDHYGSLASKYAKYKLTMCQKAVSFFNKSCTAKDMGEQQRLIDIGNEWGVKSSKYDSAMISESVDRDFAARRNKSESGGMSDEEAAAIISGFGAVLGAIGQANGNGGSGKARCRNDNAESCY